MYLIIMSKVISNNKLLLSADLKIRFSKWSYDSKVKYESFENNYIIINNKSIFSFINRLFHLSLKYIQ